jgi:hypothetical protein
MAPRAKLVKMRQGEHGQVAILFALVFTFLFVLFALVVDFGHIVNDKMNLQIAADTAAYAGAAWQARQLNRIAAVNYRLRQDWKEFAMRVNVTHMRHNRNYPRGAQYYNGAPQAPAIDPWICQQAEGYRSLSGLQYAQDTNLCRNADPATGGLPPIVVPPVIAKFDPFAIAIQSQIKQIQKAADQECAAAASDNQILAQHLLRIYERRARFHADQINALTEWVNQIANENPANSQHPLLKAAYQTAMNNLSLSNKDGFNFQIMQPTGNQYLALEPSNAQPSLFYINFQPQGGGCVGKPDFVEGTSIPVNFTKKTEVVTYFAVKLTSKPKLFFMPERWTTDSFPELVAYAAAKPFGSRIGPGAATDELVPTPNRPGNSSRLVNFSFRPGDNLGMWNTKMMAYFDALHPFNSIGRPDGNQATGWPEPNKAEEIRQPLLAIRAPTIFDALLYTIYPDPGNNKGVDYLEPQYAEALYPDYLEAADANQNTVLQLPQPRTPAYLPNAVGSKNNGPGWIQINATNTGGGDPYGQYAEEQISSHSVQSAQGLPGMNNLLDFGFATPELIHSGWAPNGRPGRLGYSVKFIGMDALVRTLRVRHINTGAVGPIDNPPTGDPNLQNIYH